MIDFPANPTLGQQFTAAGVTWTWDGAKWTSGGQSVAYLPLAGGTMLGPIVLAADPAAALQPATKQYVDGGRLGDNRIINGDMRIDQRNNGASGTAQGYTCDRWQIGISTAGQFTWQRTSGNTAPSFPYALRAISNSARTPAAGDAFYFLQTIEADQISDFQWGTANAQPITLSFWVNVSLTGIFGGAIANVAGTRAYPFTFNIPVANTWTKIVITIPGDTTGTWVMSGNAGSLYLTFDLGTGSAYRAPAGAWASGYFIGANGTVSVAATNGAGYVITGIKLEIGAVATPFNRQSLAKSMADCQRYYQVGLLLLSSYQSAAGANVQTATNLSVAMRAVPTLTSLSTTNTNISGFGLNAGGVTNAMVWTYGTATAIGNTTINCTVSASAEL